MGQIRGKNAHIDACNLRSLSSFGTPAAGQHILVSTDNSATADGQGDFDAYVEGDGVTAATALPLHKFKAEELDIQLNGIPNFDQSLHGNTTAGSSVPKNTKYDMPLENGKEYAVTITSSSLKNSTIYLNDAAGNAVSFYGDGAATTVTSFSFFLTTGTATRTIKPTADVAKVAFYTSGANVTGNDGFDVNFYYESTEKGVLNEIDERLDTVEPIANAAYNDVSLFDRYFDAKDATTIRTVDRWVQYSDGVVQIAGSTSKMEIYTITISTESYITAYLGNADANPAAIAFYNDSTPSASTYMKDDSVQIEQTNGKWFSAKVPQGAVIAVITNKYSLVASPAIKSLSTKSLGLDVMQETLEQTSADTNLLAKGFDEKNVTESPTIDRYVRYNDGNVAVAGSVSKVEKIEITLNGEFYIAAFVGFSDTTPAAIAFYNSTSASTTSYMKSASVQGETSYGQWYFAAVPAGAKLAIISNKYSYVSTPTIKTLSAKNIENAVSTSVLAKVNETTFYQPFLRKPFYSHHTPISFTMAQNETTKLIAGESLESIDMAARLGYDYIEANVHQTSDGEYVVTHGDSGKFGTMFYATNGDNITDVAINSKTLSYIKTYVRCNSSWDKYKSEMLTIDEFLDACAASEIGIFVGTTITEVVEKCVKKLGQDKVILYDAPVSLRSNFGGVMLWWNNTSGETIAGLLSQAKNYGRPFVCAIGPTVISEFKNDDILEDFVNTMHENGFYCGFAPVYQSEAETAELIRLGFDFGGSSAEVNPFDGGTLYDINMPSNITTTATITNGMVTLAANQTLQCGDFNMVVGLGKMILRIRFSGELKINFGSRVERTHTSDGSNYLTLSDYSMMRSMRLLITAVSSTIIYDLSYKVLEC